MEAPTLTPLILPPALQVEVGSIVDLLIIETVFPTLLIPVAVFLFSSTTPDVRRKPVFVLNVIAILLGLIFGGVAMACLSRAMSGREVKPGFVVGLLGLYFFIPVCVQCILFVRILAVYSPRFLSWTHATFIYGSLSAISVARVVNVGIALKRVQDGSRGSDNPWVASTVGWHVPSAKAELFMALLYDVIASSLFLLRLHQGGALKAGVPMTNQAEIITSGGRMSSYSSRLRALFWIASTNFVVPVVFGICLLIMIFHEKNIVPVIAVLSVNIYVEIISVLLATLWCSGMRPETPARSLKAGMVESISTAKFASPSVLTSRVHVELDTVHTSSGGSDST
ncbi:hypothetical protein L226DRAFT_569097 [Lentinus tigrinus ALCF2SS1-7]|uniref:uncharacterized protein n=1 Tax=Lentinus tigrinus ALCF2SS1-7 TaxID=1328758 RepID=UPI0011661C6C|nr:hypothetical protein L226DRAFT_569097 [Lentinus tigrinus ALCF2SS1-7]